VLCQSAGGQLRPRLTALARLRRRSVHFAVSIQHSQQANDARIYRVAPQKVNQIIERKKSYQIVLQSANEIRFRDSFD